MDAAAPQAADFGHLPVLTGPVLEYAPPQARVIVDATLGGGGHARALLGQFPGAELFGSDRDPDAVQAARRVLAPFAERTLIKQLRFSDLHRYLLAESADMVLADLGVSSPQLDNAARGFSFTREGPLDMRMDPASGGRTAAQLVNEAGEAELREILFRFGEERFAPRIVKAIRAARPLDTTRELAGVVAAAVPARHVRKGHHPATRTFQALRMAVNDELGELERLLEVAPHLLRPGGRVVVIAFHSLEDRLVKNTFARWEKPCECPGHLPRCVCGKTPLGVRLTRKPRTADAEEARQNPRSRSAKLRAFEKR